MVVRAGVAAAHAAAADLAIRVDERDGGVRRDPVEVGGEEVGDGADAVLAVAHDRDHLRLALGELDLALTALEALAQLALEVLPGELLARLAAAAVARLPPATVISHVPRAIA